MSNVIINDDADVIINDDEHEHERDEHSENGETSRLLEDARRDAIDAEAAAERTSEIAAHEAAMAEAKAAERINDFAARITAIEATLQEFSQWQTTTAETMMFISNRMEQLTPNAPLETETTDMPETMPETSSETRTEAPEKSAEESPASETEEKVVEIKPRKILV